MKTPAEYREMEFAELFVALAKLFKPKEYFELGVKKGYTIKQMSRYCEKATGIDIKIPHIDHVEYPNIKLIENTTLDYAKSLVGTEPFIDMLFIDADHRYESVIADFHAYSPFVKFGTGLIFLHDTHPIKQELLAPGYCNDAWRAAESIHRNPDKLHFEIATLPGPWAGLSIIRKLNPRHHLAWIGA